MDIKETEKQADLLKRSAAALKRLRQLEKGTEEKDKIELSKPYYNFLNGSTILLSIASFTLALGCIFWLQDKLDNVFAIILLSCILFSLEPARHYLYKQFHKQRIYQTNISKVLKFLMLTVVVLTVASSFLGSAYTVAYLSKNPVSISLDSIGNNYKSLYKQDSIYWNGKVNLAAESAANFKESNSWKGRISRKAGVKETYANLTAKKAAYSDSLTTTLARSKNTKIAALNFATVENQNTEKAYQKWCADLGFTMALLSIVFELLFFGISWYCANFEKDELFFLKAYLADKQLPEAEAPAPIVAAPKAEAEAHKAPKAEANTDLKQPINKAYRNATEQPKAIVKHGTVIKGEGAKQDRIAFQKLDKSFKLHTKGTLKSAIKSARTKEAKNRLKDLLKTWENAN
jgi:hypothetical protein